jgi:DNA-binding NtrC family response regulator
MDFYNLQENDRRLIEQTMNRAADPSSYKDYLQRYFFNFDRVYNKKNILLVEEDPRIQRAMQKMIREANQEAQFWIADSVDEILDTLDKKECDLLIANYYLSEDEIDYEFWEVIRARFPLMDVIILSHVNDREYYEALEKMSQNVHEGHSRPFSTKLKHFFEHVFGG